MLHQESIKESYVEKNPFCGWFSAEQVAEHWRVERQVIYEMIKNGKIIAIYVGGNYRIHRKMILEIEGKTCEV